jgi:predicted MFS family arabinose efflux permease
MGAPPYIAALGLLLGGAYLADRFKRRAWLIVLQASLSITGLCLVLPGHSAEVRFLGTFFAVMGAQCNTPALLSFQQNNCVGSSKRSLAAAMNSGAGAIGGIIGRYYLHVPPPSDFMVI